MTILLALITGLLMASTAVADEPVSEPEPIYWKQLAGTGQPDAGQSVIEPEEILHVTGMCDGCGYRIVDLTWTGWGSDTAIGRGKIMPLLGGSGDPNAKVYLTKVRQICGESRYMNIRTVSDGYSIGYPDANCQGRTKPLDSPIPPPKPKLKLRTAKAVFQKTAAEGGRLNWFKKQSVRCARVARLRVRCRGRWIFRGTTLDGEKFTWRYKGAGWVKKRDRNYTAKIVFRLRVKTAEEAFTSPSETEWGYYAVRG